MEGTAADGTEPAGGQRPDERPSAPPGAAHRNATAEAAGSAQDLGPQGPRPAGEPAGGSQGGGRPKGIRTGRNLPAAIGVGVVLGALVLVSLYTVKALFLLVVLAAVGIGVVEMARALATRDAQVPMPTVLTGLVAMLAGAYWGGTIWLLGAFTLTVLVLLVQRMLKGAEGYVRDASAGVLTAVYPALIAGFVPLMLSHEDGADRVVIFVAVTVCSDIGGYFAGILFGKHKMSIISPKKTWEGFAGSVLACVLCGALLVRFLLEGQFWQGAVVGAVVAVCATLGDLVESVIKRDLGIKDMGNVLPGHGGLMDRLDSLLATLFPIWLLLAIFIPS
ncbi:phosphatidate cytidylyltransferase [Sphaerisporangium sp. NPDC005289]|uniref:phosphatidate cytidylyltransferase n=1 Tax=Sphaerisporangium sp. NPDC005289 TaxID=3155247 RepID=UPI0033AF0080